MRLGTMLEQPVPRKINADSDGVVAPSTKPLEVAMPSRRIERERDRKTKMNLRAWWNQVSERVVFLIIFIATFQTRQNQNSHFFFFSPIIFL